MEFVGVKIVVKKGSITDEEVGAIVNPANSYLQMGGGVAGIIKREGGAIIEEEALKNAPIPIGDAVATTAGRLKSRYVIHAPTMNAPGPTTIRNVYLATKAALLCANKIGVESVAIPGMGTGVGGISLQDGAETMIRAIKEHIASGTKLKTIVLIAINENLLKQFMAAARTLQRES